MIGPALFFCGVSGCDCSRYCGKPLESTALSMIREVVFRVGFALLLPIWFGLDGVLYSMPLADILTFAVSIVILICTYRELKG